MYVRVDSSVRLVYIPLSDDSSVAVETSDTAGHCLRHLRHLLRIFLNGAGKEEVGALPAYPGKLRKFFGRRHCITDIISRHAPLLRVL